MRYRNCIIHVLVCIAFAGCRIENNKRLEFALASADTNRTELEHVLEHYKNDTLKYMAARYLMENMPYHFTKDEYFVSPDGIRMLM